jgi:predicted DNA-binding protein (MmcQ/YjbR family)
MIDIDTYKQFHPPDGSKPPNRDDLGPSIMSQESPPLGDEFLLCLPTRIPGYHMQKKQWSKFQVPAAESEQNVNKMLQSHFL